MRPRLLLAALPLLVAACADEVVAVGPVAGEPVDVAAMLRPLNLLDSQDQKEGRLVYMGILRLDSADIRFGGISGLVVSADGLNFLAVTDAGHWLWGDLAYDGDGWLAGVRNVRLAPLLDPEGRALDGKEESDAEGLTAARPNDLSGDVLVSFERDHRIWRYEWGTYGAAARAWPVPVNAEVSRLPDNASLEAIAAVDGTIFYAGEQGFEDGPKDADGEGLETPLWTACLDSCVEQSFTLALVPPFSVTDMAVTPDRQLLTLERHFSPLTGVRAQLRLLPMEEFSREAPVNGPVIASFGPGDVLDNMEGVSVRRGAHGETLVYLVSDDNFNRGVQATLLMLFRLEGPESVQ